MNTTDAGRLGEIKVASMLVEDGWFIFTDYSGKCTVDLIAWKDGVTKTFQVKTTGYSVNGGPWLVQLKSVRPNRTENKIKLWENVADALGVYIVPEDRVVIIEAKDITQKTQLSLPRISVQSHL